MANLMAKRTEPNGLLFLGELLSSGRDFKPKMDELVSVLNWYQLYVGVVKSEISTVVIPVSDDLLFLC